MARSLLDRQLSRVRRRLFLTTLLSQLTWAWVVALLLGSGWLLVQPYLVPAAPDILRWLVPSVLMSLATLTGVLLAVRRSPSSLRAALALDERFGLKERVTTSLGLGETEANTPAGQALLADVERQLTGVRVAERFPVRVPRLPAVLIPLGLTAVILLALFWNPEVGAGRTATDDPLAAAPQVKEDLEQKLQQLAAKAKEKKAVDPIRAEEMERINQEIEKFTRAPRDTREEVRDRIKDATSLEEQIRREQQEQAERIDAFKEALKQMERLSRKNREEQKQGPANQAADALAQGDMRQLQEELQRLSRQLENEDKKESLRRKQRDPQASQEEKKQAEEELKKLQQEQELTQKDRDQLARQLEQMENDLKQLSRNKQEKEQELRDLADKGELDKDALERELEQMQKLDKDLEKDKKDLEELAKELSQCKKCMKEGNCKQASQSLAKAGQKAGQLGQKGNEKELAQKLALIQQVKRSLCRSLSGQAGVGSGKRPETKEDELAHKEALVPGEWDKGKLEVIGQGPFGGFNGPRKPAEMQEEIRQASQEAPAALDRQRLPPSARKMARGYFEKLRGPQKPKDK